jgi:predicted dehydrogenase
MTTAIVVGTGGMARHHIRAMLDQQDTTELIGFVEVSEDQRAQTRAIYDDQGTTCPPFFDSISDLLASGLAPETAFIVTPHKFHLENATDCLEGGMDVLLEKPMVLDQREAEALIGVRNRTGRLLVVGFPGSLSPAVKKAKELIADGVIGRVTGVSAHAHQHWKVATTGTWRQVPEISGGGFLFDTGSHMINTVVDIIGCEVEQVAAIMDNCGTPVEINSAVSGRFSNGVMFSLAGIGDSTHCASLVRVFGEAGVLETGIWGERLSLKLKDDGDYNDVDYPGSKGVWEQFIAVRAGEQENPCPPEVGLRFAKLMDMIRQSAASGETVRS